MEQNISDYIEYLKDEHGLEISVHMDKMYTGVFYANAVLSRFGIHTNPYCFGVKTNGGQKKCMACQRSVIRKCSEYKSFTGECHAGVLEFIHRIEHNGTVYGYVCASGYRGTHASGAHTEELKKDAPPAVLLGCVMPPLAYMIGVYMHELVKLSEPDDIYSRITAYLEENHANTTLSELSAALGYSRSHISHIFNARAGMTISEYCNLLKVRDAKLMLEQSSLSVTQICYTAGFGDLSYFIKTFARIAGMTPLKWRAAARSKKNEI